MRLVGQLGRLSCGGFVDASGLLCALMLVSAEVLQHHTIHLAEMQEVDRG